MHDLLTQAHIYFCVHNTVIYDNACVHFHSYTSGNMWMAVSLRACPIIHEYASVTARGGGDAPASKKSRTTDGVLGGHTVRWEWEADGGQWTRYSATFNASITDALENNKAQVRLLVQVLYLKTWKTKLTMTLEMTLQVMESTVLAFTLDTLCCIQ